MKLIDFRHARTWSINELAEKSGTSYNTIAAIERGTKPKRVSIARKLAGALGVAPQYIDEFQPLVGMPETIVASIPPDGWAKIAAHLDTANLDEAIDADEFWRQVEQEAISTTA